MLKDTAHFTQGAGAALLVCRDCGSLSRDPDLESAADLYARDRYDAELLESLRERFLVAYMRDAAWFAALGLPASARVLEIGSYAGGFLSFAERMGWEAIGADAGEQTARFCRAKGLAVVQGPFGTVRFPGVFDAVFILNCFEQMDDPARVLSDVRSLLPPGGPLMIRTPSASFVRLAYALPAAAGRRLLAAASLGGVPYRRCFTLAALSGLLERSGYACRAVRGRAPESLATTVLADTPLSSSHLRGGLFRLLDGLSRRAVLFPWMDVVAERRPRLGGEREC